MILCPGNAFVIGSFPTPISTLRNGGDRPPDCAAWKGLDPRVERRRQRTPGLTFKEAATRVHTAHAVTFRDEKHRAQWLSSLEAHISCIWRPVSRCDRFLRPAESTYADRDNDARDGASSLSKRRVQRRRMINRMRVFLWNMRSCRRSRRPRRRRPSSGGRCIACGSTVRPSPAPLRARIWRSRASPSKKAELRTGHHVLYAFGYVDYIDHLEPDIGEDSARSMRKKRTPSHSKAMRLPPICQMPLG